LVQLLRGELLVLLSIGENLRAVLAVATGASIGYCLLATFAAVKFARQRKAGAPAATSLPPVSILKPLKGADPEMYEALRSHCVQEYPEYEMLCGVTAADDQAIPVVERLIREFPDAKIRLVLCDKRLGANGKVSSLIQLAAGANAEFLVVNDSDIRVSPDYLRTIIMELRQPGTGLVTCLYRGTAGRTLASRLESLGISTDFMPGVLTANLIENGMHFGLGSTLAFRKSDLQEIGGCEAIVDYLADDYELGNRIAQRKQVVLSRSVVETHLPDYDFSGFISHQLRWARTIRASRPGGYAGLLLTFTLPWAVAELCVSRNPLGLGLFAAACVARISMALVSSRLVLRERSASLWFLPLRDFVAVGVWIAGLGGRKISWRGEEFTLEKGLLKRVS
jgi:ceramide glucosyltransferase